MRCRYLLFILGIVLLVLLTACGGECKTDGDCSPRRAFDANCIDKECKYTPIPNECGNRQCEPAAGENECTCPIDCGDCTGPVEGSTSLVQQCVNDECIEDVKASVTSIIYSTADISAGGDKFKIETEYVQPFNLKKDQFAFTITLSQQVARNSKEHLLTAELTAITKDRRTLILGQKDINKYLWATGSSITEELIFDFPTGALEEELSSLALKITYEYLTEQGAKKILKTGTIKNRYKEKFTYVNPSVTYACPSSCDDGNPGTRDSCGPQTNYFCMHEPLPNACGNFICDTRETKCGCPQDCGPCSGIAGVYLDYSCERNKCVTILKSGVTVKQNSIFDDKSLGPVQLNNNYNFNNPFNINQDRFDFDFAIYRQDPTVSSVVIETVRLLEGTQQLAEQTVNKELGETPITVSIEIPRIAQVEEDHQINLKIWYKYTQNGEEKRGNFQKSLGKITFIAPQ